MSDITIPNVEFEFAEPKSDTQSNDDSIIISTQIQRLEIRLERVRLAYEDGADTLEEYKANKKSILSEIDGLKKALEKSREKISKGKDEICKKRGYFFVFTKYPRIFALSTTRFSAFQLCSVWAGRHHKYTTNLIIMKKLPTFFSNAGGGI